MVLLLTALLLLLLSCQVLAFDMNVMVEEVYLQKGILLRGLAHPGLMRDNAVRARRLG